jgi:phosphatidylserine decarboxylase
MFTKYGYSTLSIISIISLIIILTGIFAANQILKYILIILPSVFLLFSFYFFRDPDRTPPDKDNIILSPADGRILFVKDVIDNKYIKGNAKQISIFMSPLDVHVNRIPISGELEYLKYYKGKYIAAFEDKASEKNERAEFGIKSKNGNIFFTQVAGFIARRIIYKIKTGDNVIMGERFGMIKFGSRADVVVSDKWQPKVKKGEHVKGGESILFEYVDDK